MVTKEEVRFAGRDARRELATLRIAPPRRPPSTKLSSTATGFRSQLRGGLPFPGGHLIKSDRFFLSVFVRSGIKTHDGPL